LKYSVTNAFDGLEEQQNKKKLEAKRTVSEIVVPA